MENKITWATKECYDFNYPSTYIVAAAMVYDGRIYAGMRHNICYAQLRQEGLRYDPKLETGSGFLDNHGNFLDREEAWILADKTGQISFPHYNTGKTLFSEGLW